MTRLTCLFLFATLLAACTAGSRATTPTVSATPTAMPTPAGLDELPQGLTAVYDGAWRITIEAGDQAQPLPGAVFDSTGLHLTLESARKMDIPASEIEKRVVYDQELNLLTISDDQGIISAEYDPGVGQPDSPDYIPGQGWVDLQKLATDLDCLGSTCIYEAVRQPNSTSFEFASTGIFRWTDVIDIQTGNVKGRLLISQVASRDANDKPIATWFISDVESYSRPGYSFFPGRVQVMEQIYGEPIEDYRSIFLPSIDQWRKWMPKGSTWSFGLSSDGRFADVSGTDWSFTAGTQFTTADKIAERLKFLSSKGVESSTKIVLDANSGPRIK